MEKTGHYGFTIDVDLDSAKIDFTPLFNCIHIHDVLNKRVQLKLEFDESRRVTSPLPSYRRKLL
jgi:hypothetical protein